MVALSHEGVNDEGRVHQRTDCNVRFRRLTEAAATVSGIVSSNDLQAPPGATVCVRDFFGKRGNREPGPQAFLVESFPAAGRTGAHFHDVDQFQVFFPAPGAWYQRTKVDHVSVHYTDAYTTYGPFGSGPNDDSSFFTLRPMSSGITAYMPASRELLRRAGPCQRRNRHESITDGREASPGIATLFKSDDGLAAFISTADTGTPFEWPDEGGMTHGGRYCLVINGTLRHNDSEYGPMSLAWIDAEPIDESLVAGTSRTQLIVMQFPRR